MLFDAHSAASAPLAERVRPASLSDVIGQEHLSPLFKMAESGFLPSLIFWGPPGTGKTTLAVLLAKALGRPFRTLNAVHSGVKDIREVTDFAGSHPGTILFIDEIHRFNKSQQDALLQATERGLLVLIGATTENPSFEVISALLSRCRVYTLEALSAESMEKILRRACSTDTALRKLNVTLQSTEALYRLSGGDARTALNLLEVTVRESQTSPDGQIIVTDEAVARSAQSKIAFYDKYGEQHYDLISAFIKSVRGSDPDGALYWLARMLEGGETPRFIARRLMVLASEDIGNANPNALMLAVTGFQACEAIGMPEARIILAQVTTYLAASLKSNASYVGISEAIHTVRKGSDPAVPLHLRNAPTGLMKELNYGSGYKYSHDYEGIKGAQQYLPDELKDCSFYRPKDIGREKDLKAVLKYYWGDRFEGG